MIIPVTANVERDFNIIIAHRGDCLGLWATIQSCEIELKHYNYQYSYLIVTNGEDPISPDTYNTIEFLRKSGKLGYHEHSNEPLSPPYARQRGTTRADGKYLFFFDNHCLVERDYFKNAIECFENDGADLIHSTTKFNEGGVTAYHYLFELQKNFWAQANDLPKSDKPYRIGAGGHGGFAVRRTVWEEVGGYWDGFVGYGGEEMYFDLKLWQLGYSVWLHPNMVHWHYPGRRTYIRHFTDDFYRNMMACANIIGGIKWMDKVAASFQKCNMKAKTGKTMFDLYNEAEDVSRSHAAWLSSKCHKSLDELLVWFKENDIPF